MRISLPVPSLSSRTHKGPLLPCPQLSRCHVSLGCSAITFSTATCVGPSEPSIQTLSVQATANT